MLERLLGVPMHTTACAMAPRPSRLFPIIRAEFEEMPGLNLTLAQAARLWDVEPWLCRDALEMLVKAGFLATFEDRYVRADRLWRFERGLSLNPPARVAPPAGR